MISCESSENSHHKIAERFETTIKLRSDCLSDDSAYLADCDDIGAPQKSIVQLSHTVLTDFLKGQIVKVANEGSQPVHKKKRYYDNSKRAAAAASAKRLKNQTGKNDVSRLPCNSEDSYLF